VLDDATSHSGNCPNPNFDYIGYGGNSKGDGKGGGVSCYGNVRAHGHALTLP